jgi:hypothetical protein
VNLDVDGCFAPNFAVRFYDNTLVSLAVVLEILKQLGALNEAQLGTLSGLARSSQSPITVASWSASPGLCLF